MSEKWDRPREKVTSRCAASSDDSACLSCGIRSTAVKMDEKLHIFFTKFGPILTA